MLTITKREEFAQLNRDIKVKLLIAELALMSNNARFVGVTYTSKETKETARYTLLMNASYHKLVEESLLELSIQRPNLKGIDLQACLELQKSFQNTLDNHKLGLQNDNYTKKGVYERIVPGLQISRNDGTLEICGVQHAKAVLIPGEYKEVKSRELTLAKNRLRGLCKVSKWRTLCVDAGNLQAVRMNGETLELE